MIIRFFSALFALLFSLLGLRPAAERRCEAKVTGSFIQSWYCADWDGERWAEEAAFMRELGLEYLVLQTTADMDASGNWTAWYPSELPELSDCRSGGVIEGALRSCREAGIRVFVGLADFAGWWDGAGAAPDFDAVCGLMTRMQREIYEKYSPEYGDTLFGWYFAPELDNVPAVRLSLGKIAEGLSGVLDTATELDPAMPVMMSPFFTEYTDTPSVLATLPMWTSFFEKARFRDGDVFCPQDAVGAGWTKEEHLEKVWKMYRAAVDNAPVELKLWANCECFTSAIETSSPFGPPANGLTENTPAPLDRFERQLDIASKYAERVISFSVNHYYSPFTDPEAYERFRDAFA